MEWSEGTDEVTDQVVERFRVAEDVYYISISRLAIALGPDFKTRPEQAYVLVERYGYDPANSAQKFLKDNQISYHEISYPNEGTKLVSHNGRFVTKLFGEDGFYTVDGTKIGPAKYPFSALIKVIKYWQNGEHMRALNSPCRIVLGLVRGLRRRILIEIYRNGKLLAKRDVIP